MDEMGSVRLDQLELADVSNSEAYKVSPGSRAGTTREMIPGSYFCPAPTSRGSFNSFGTLDPSLSQHRN